MTSLLRLVYARCTGYAPLVALIGTRCHADRVPERATYPLVIYQAPIADTDGPYRSHGGGPNRVQSLVSFSAYAASQDEAESVADELVAAWNGYSSGDIGYAFVENRIAERQDSLGIYRQIVDVTIEHKR